MNKKTCKLISIIAIVALAVCVTGCRPSYKLEKIRYTAFAEAVDEDQEMLDIEEDGRIEEYLNNVKEQEALEQLAETMEIGPEDDASSDDINSRQIIYDTSGKNENSDEEPSEKDPNAIYKDMGVEEINDIPTARAGDVSTSKLVADATGEEVELPKNVNKAVAVGVAAQIVEMTAGSGRLAATDEETKNNEFCKLVMTDLDEVLEWWEGDGSLTPISDENFNLLLMDSEIDVCFEMSGAETFTEEQVQTLLEYNINYIVLYPLTSIENLKLDVQIVGQVMTNGSGDKNDSASKAESYVKWVDSTLSEVEKATSDFGRYTVYIAGWDDSAEYTLTLTDSNPFPDTDDVDAEFGLDRGSGSGLAYAYTKYASELFSETAASANVTNTSTINTVRVSDSDNNSFVYVAPVFESYRAGGGQSITGKFSVYSGNINAGYTPFLYRLIASTTVVALGNGNFPAVIVSSEEVMNKIAENVFWNYHGYSGPLYVGSFYVYVNPTGMGSWVEGSLETPLEAKWVACRIDQVYTIDEILAETVNFYSQFFFDGNPPEEVEEQLTELVKDQLMVYTELVK